MIRLQDIADMAGVSRTTVSNVINGNTKRVSQETIDKITAILKEQNYVPHMGSVMLSGHGSRIIGVVVGFNQAHGMQPLQDSFVGELVGTIQNEAEAKGYYIMLIGGENIQHVVDIASRWNVEGLIILGYNDEKYRQLSRKLNKKMVLIDTYPAGEYFFQNVKSIFEADDLTIANNEGTFTESYDREDKTFAFKAPASFAGIYSCSSVEAVNTANNHSHDYGEQSFQDTMDALDAEGIVHFGYDETAVMDVKGVKVGLIGIYELNDHLERKQQLEDNINKVKDEGAELVIVIFHWGNEKETVPDSNQTTLGRLAIDLGADLVCGHHPHVLQGVEEYKGKNIVYSLGNFCFGGNSSPSDMDTMIFQQTFTITNDGVQDDNVTNIIPCSISSASDYNNYQPTPAEGDEKTRIMEKIQERSSWIDTENTY